ncbi:hypothetical protein GCM10022276_12180 [Sphingomonas limnosediminicola]|uniref:Ice-binding protein C-terminal domain-containing protein n=1 Tax=Sphingomonas limnosediminicola TaxID=940133 RepID=A0ABP7L406_9SPHN
MNGSSFSTFGHIGVSSDASSASGSSLGNGISSEALFRDVLFFSSTNPALTGADIQMSLLLQGIMGFDVSAGGAGSSIEGSLSVSGTAPSFFFFRFFDDSSGSFSVEQNPFAVAGTLGSTIDAVLTSPVFHVDFDGPTQLTLRLQSGSSTGGDASAFSHFGSSFAFASTPFLLPDGVTVSAGDYLVDDHFIDPLAAVGVPEPDSWMTMLLGFCLMGLTVRRRRRVYSPDKAQRPT